MATRNVTGAAPEADRQARSGVEKLARLGFATKGVVYIIIGVLAVQAAFGAGGETTGSKGAIQTIAEQPFGQVLLIITALGLFGYALWRFVEAALDVENVGNDAKGVAKRLGYTGSGIIYLFLSFQAASAAFGWSVLGGGGGGGGGSSQQEWTARLMSQPFGQWLVAIAGIIVIGVAIYQVRKAVKASFMERYRAGEMSPDERKWAKRIGQFGFSARGLVFAIIGGFLVVAAWQAQPGEARGLSGALDTLATQPYGPWLLALVAAGLVAYGVFCFSRARYSDFST